MARASRYDEVAPQVLDAIWTNEAAHSKAPTVRELAGDFEVGVATMHSYLARLEGAGLIETRDGRHRSIRLTDEGRKAIVSA